MTRQQIITVLVIDDDEDDRFFIKRAFRTSFPDTLVYEAASGRQALDLLSCCQSLPDVILLDLNMPGMNGFDVLEHLKQSLYYRHLPVVILTTSNERTDQERARQLGAIDFVTKPPSYTSLSAIVEQIQLRLFEHGKASGLAVV